MGEDAHGDDRAAIGRLVEEINAAWVGGRPERLAAYFHEDMVIISPRFQDRVEGRDTCVASYGEFVAGTRIHHYHATDPDVHVVGDAAVATYRYAITYSIDTTDFQEVGWDVWVFVRVSGAWQAIWRTVVPAP
ncbi:MAG: nuclear transport factor 2 family protein [Armatimonadota bacterium]|nr:nuclear transport factor 2 family protein [Armatimonadota bacterium]